LSSILNPEEPDLLLVKRITRLIPGDGGADIPYTGFVDDGEDRNGDGTNDNSDPGWPSATYTSGEVSIQASPEDQIEYTIYFLNTGDGSASNVQICDAFNDFITYLSSTYNPFVTNAGIELNFNGSSTYLTGINDGDQGQFIEAGNVSGCQIDNPANPNQNPLDLIPLANPNGTIRLDLSSNISPTTGTGTPLDSYGYIRFRVQVE
jgi:uncharacterized repeat protein (TIGR01451 family)